VRSPCGASYAQVKMPVLIISACSFSAPCWGSYVPRIVRHQPTKQGKQVSQTGGEEEQKSAVMPQTLRRAGDVLGKTRVQLHPGTPSERDERRGGVRLQSSRFLCRMVTRPHVKASR
jgi:hypothetical protein